MDGMKDGPIDVRMDRPNDEPTDRPIAGLTYAAFYGDARMLPKMRKEFSKDNFSQILIDTDSVFSEPRPGSPVIFRRVID